ncbi:hypothetical protein FKM82_000356 [Ascaphus truei]
MTVGSVDMGYFPITLLKLITRKQKVQTILSLLSIEYNFLLPKGTQLTCRQLLLLQVRLINSLHHTMQHRKHTASPFQSSIHSVN